MVLSAVIRPLEVLYLWILSLPPTSLLVVVGVLPREAIDSYNVMENRPN